MRDMLVNQSAAPAADFWRVIDQEILPAVRSGDLDCARQGLARADAAYEAHRAVIAKVVVMANRDAQAVERPPLARPVWPSCCWAGPACWCWPGSAAASHL
ncbi:hypothetical protein [Caulobacter sp. DWR2-3-1b2]|uniref:hypothetical protein n=1 Tax=Caulobacter sp. DWR2-3-1b2 TaxID=2804642 RepID=UPI003CF29E01